MSILDLLINVLMGAMAIITCVVIGVACIAAGIENDERKKNMRAGTHDYYGNKLDD